MSEFIAAAGDVVGQRVVDRVSKKRRCKILDTIKNDISKIEETEPNDDVLDDLSDLRVKVKDLEEEFKCKVSKGKNPLRLGTIKIK